MIAATVVLPAVLLTFLTGVEAGPDQPPAAQEPFSSRVERTLRFDDRDRTFLLHDFAGSDIPAPLVIVLHGGGGNAENAVQMTGFDRVAARERFIVAYPDGTRNDRPRGRLGQALRERNLLLTWNAGHCCASAMARRVDDVGFIGAVIDDLTGSGRVDPSRVYVTGMSNGAMLAHRIGRELSRKVAAIAPVVGAVFGDEPAPQAPVSAFIVVGAEDEVVPPQGGPLRLRALLGNASAADRDVAPALAQATYWATHNGCGEGTRRETATSTATDWIACRSGAPVVFHSVKDNGHAWPGGRAGRRGAAEPSTAFDATEEIWDFFASHRRQP